MCKNGGFLYLFIYYLLLLVVVLPSSHRLSSRPEGSSHDGMDRKANDKRAGRDRPRETVIETGTTRVNILSFGQLFSISCGSPALFTSSPVPHSTHSDRYETERIG